MMDRRLVRYGFVTISTLLVAFFAGCDPKESFDYDSPFPHAAHQAAGLECNTCHIASGAEMSFPTISVCTGCHEMIADDPVGKLCGECHDLSDKAFTEGEAPMNHRLALGVAKPDSYREVAFNHEKHTTGDPDCMVCHVEMKDETIQRIFSPTMDQSVAFFKDQGKPVPPCSDCHAEYDIDSEPRSHLAGHWEIEHGQVTRFEGTTECMYCHQENTCTTCHEQTQPRSHTALFRLQTHGLEAEWGRESCMTCHRVDFCERCHQEVQPRSHTAGWSGTMNNHCMNCHAESGEQAGCFACHKQGVTQQTHVMEAPMPDDPFYRDAHYNGSPCMICHSPAGGPIPGVALRHPLVDEDQCGLCHRF